jgi:hypothetical protein
VWTSPGATAFTRIPWAANCSAADFVRPDTPCLLATLLTVPAVPTRPTTEPLFTIAFAYGGDPIVDNLVSNFSRPEANVTGTTFINASPFNLWLDAQVKNSDGSLDLDRLYKVASSYGIKNDYRHLNPGQQRMTIGIKLRSKVPPSEYGTTN